jgi:hypothetical protein
MIAAPQPFKDSVVTHFWIPTKIKNKKIKKKKPK